MKINRRDLLAGIGSAGAGLILSSCSLLPRKNRSPSQPSNEDITAVEDLMREHGILRRALIVYSESAVKLRSGSATTLFDALHKTAGLFRAFG